MACSTDQLVASSICVATDSDASVTAIKFASDSLWSIATGEKGHRLSEALSFSSRE